LPAAAAFADLAVGWPPPNICSPVLVLAKSIEKISPLAGQPPPIEKFSPAADHGCSLALALAQVLKSQVTRTPHAAYDGEPVYKERGWRKERMRCYLQAI
jgi:hypothetical protein